MVRIFVAFPIPENLSETFLKVSKKNQIKDIRWTIRENLHITLFFIGEVQENNLDRIINALSDIFVDQKKFQIIFDSIIFKGRKKNPSMIWAAFEKNDAFSELNHSIYESVNEYMTIDPEHKDPIPHITLARLKQSAAVSEVKLDVDLEKGTMVLVDHAELWKTIQTKDGVKYERLASYKLM